MARIKYGKHYRNEIAVSDLEDKPEFILENIDYNVDSIKEHIGEVAYEYDSFFVLLGEAEYIVVYGMYGSVPYNNKTLYKVYEVK